MMAACPSDEAVGPAWEKGAWAGFWAVSAMEEALECGLATGASGVFVAVEVA